MNSLRTVLQWAVGTLLLAMLLHTWLLMGLIEPVHVAGSSMMPTLRGPHHSITCKKCGKHFSIGTEFPSATLECLACGFAGNSTEGQSIQHGDRLIVDRTAYQFRQPRRWEVVVFHSPADNQLTIKRVVGLPGETMELRDGDLRINNQVATKSLAEMRGLRQLVHEETNTEQRWHGTNWRWNHSAWQITTTDNQWHWLRYRHSRQEPITNDMAYNAATTRRVFPVRDLCLSAKVRVRKQGDLALRFDNGSDHFSWQGELSRDVLLEFFSFDRRCQVFLDGRLVASKILDSNNKTTETSSPLAIGAKNIDLTLSDLRISHDLYHVSLSEEGGLAAPMTPITLSDHEFYVLGDNAAVSLDSRHWGPIPLRFLVGKPLAVR